MLLIYFMARAFKRACATGATGAGGKDARADASQQCPLLSRTEVPHSSGALRCEYLF